MNAPTLKQAMAKTEEPKTVKDILASPHMRHQMQQALPKHLNADRMARVMLTLMRQNPKLASAEPKSFLGAMMQVAQLGLEPGSALGHCYLIPFDKSTKVGDKWVKVPEVQVVIGYRGMIDLARRSGQIVSLSARVVHAKDSFRYGYGLEETLDHVPYEGEDPGDATHFYAVAKLQGGGVQFEVMSLAQVIAVRDNSQGYQAAARYAKENQLPDSPWSSHFEEMGRKTVVRRLFKYLPVSIEIQRAVGLDEQADAGISQGNAHVYEGDFDMLPKPADDDPTPQGDQAQGFTVQEVHNQLSNAKTSEQLDDAWNNKSLIAGLSKQDETALGKLYAARDKELRG
jgi:recombination protein RecT